MEVHWARGRLPVGPMFPFPLIAPAISAAARVVDVDLAPARAGRGSAGPAVVDNYATHKHAKVTRHPRWTFHFTPTSASWLNAVEGFFAKHAPALKRGVFRSVIDLGSKFRVSPLGARQRARS